MDYIYVTSAEDAGNLCVRLTFNDGHQSVVDILSASIRIHSTINTLTLICFERL